MAKRIQDLDKNFQDAGSKVEEGLKWISSKDPRFTVNGLAWYEENNREFLRLPKRAKGVVRDPVWELSTMPTGARVRFKTDSTTLKLRIQHSRMEIAMPHMCAVGVSGVDLYEGPPHKMTYWVSSKIIEAPKPYVAVCFEKMPRKMREFTLFLPSYNDLVLLEFGLDPDAKLAAPSPYRLKKPVLFYGTSVTQGGCSTRCSTNFVPMVGRTLGIDVINLGFSGNGTSDPEVADLIAELDLACFVNDCVANMSMERMKTHYADFNEKIRARWPKLPILFMTSFLFAGERYLPQQARDWKERNAIAIRTYQRFRQRGDRNAHLLDTHKAVDFGPDHPSVDGVHLSDIGFQAMADAVAPALRKILKLR
jgi:lysophospholipase L1-like esterase